ncbi:hypothetical protein MICCA_2070013 [Microcystis aeruginosa PCC 9432]|uniref:Uncharacterized protein n=1 Tax=Microcystis aeruginosa PCC 9432 TaxID=1160280 RepID=A0A822L7W5_MICAE|nr:hypothetical protein MICCA_2070013 [Microcystis aeruginosa PCC 9432]
MLYIIVFVKNASCSRAKYIYGCLNDAYLKHKNELDSLLTLRFQKFNKSQIMTI